MSTVCRQKEKFVCGVHGSKESVHRGYKDVIWPVLEMFGVNGNLLNGLKMSIRRE